MRLGLGFLVLNATFNNISVLSWQSVLLVEETGIPGENYRPVQVTNKFITYVVSSIHHMKGIWLTMLVVLGTDCIGSYKSNYHTIMATTAPDDFKAKVWYSSSLKILLWILFVTFAKKKIPIWNHHSKYVHIEWYDCSTLNSKRPSFTRQNDHPLQDKTTILYNTKRPSFTTQFTRQNDHPLQEHYFYTNCKSG
jgi:hypothetical protein